jgi:hypothetical protein
MVLPQQCAYEHANSHTSPSCTPTTIRTEAKLRFITLNPRGLDHVKLLRLKMEVFCKYDVTFLQETHLASWYSILDELDEHEYFVFRSDHNVPRGATRCRGVAVIIKACSVKQETVPKLIYRSDDGRIVIVQFEDTRSNPLTVSSVYLPSDGAAQRVSYMTEHTGHMPWHLLRHCIIGTDSNLITCSAEKANGQGVVGADGALFIDMLDKFELVDLYDLNDAIALAASGGVGVQPHVKRVMTFYNGSNSVNPVSCIDRIIVPASVTHIIDTCKATIPMISDHLAVEAALISTLADSNRPKVPRRMRTAYLDNRTVREEVRALRLRLRQSYLPWAGRVNPYIYLKALLTQIGEILDRHHNANIERRRAARLRTWRKVKSHAIKQSNDMTLSEATRLASREKLAEMKIKINRVYAIISDEIKAEIRAKWNRKHIDAKSLFVKHRSKQTIDAVKMPDSTMSFEDEDIAQQFLSVWKEIFAPVNPQPQRDASVRECLDCITARPELAGLSMDLTVADLAKALKKMKRKTPGPERADCHLFVMIPELLQDIHLVWQSRHQYGLPEEWLTAWLVPLYKKGSRSEPLNYRLISLLCVSFKLITSANNTRLLNALADVIGVEQQAFLPGRDIREAVCQILATAGDAREYDKPLALLFFDFRKAYDSCSRAFILAVLKEYGLSDAFCADMSMLLHNRYVRFVINGRLSERLRTTTGLPQGDALSCTLYILMVSVLPQLARNKGVVGYSPHRFASVNITAVQMVDDLTGMATHKKDPWRWKTALMTFREASGQTEATSKMKIIVVRGDPRADFEINKTGWRMNCVLTGDEKLRSLGFWLDKEAKIHPYMWTQLTSGVSAAVKRYSTQRTSIFERGALLLGAITARLNFVARVVPIPSSVSRNITSLAWNTFMFRDQRTHVARELAQRPASVGGLSRVGMGSIANRAVATLGRSFLAFASRARVMYNDWYHLSAARDLEELDNIPPNLINGPKFDDNIMLAYNNPAAWSRAAAAKSQLVCSDWVRLSRLAADDVDGQPLYNNPLIDPELRPGDDPQLLAMNTTHVRDLFTPSGAVRSALAQSPEVKSIETIDTLFNAGWLRTRAAGMSAGHFALDMLVSAVEIVSRGGGVMEVTFPFLATIVDESSDAPTHVTVQLVAGRLDEEVVPAPIASEPPFLYPAANLLRVVIDSCGIARSHAMLVHDPERVGLPTETPAVVGTIRRAIDWQAANSNPRLIGKKRRLVSSRVHLSVNFNLCGIRTRLLSPQQLKQKPRFADRFLPMRRIATRHLLSRLSALYDTHAPPQLFTAFDFNHIRKMA